MPIDTAVIGTVVMDVTAESVGLQADWKDKQRIDGIRLAIGGDGVPRSRGAVKEGKGRGMGALELESFDQRVGAARKPCLLQDCPSAEVRRRHEAPAPGRP